ncbi:hypothetical protein SAMN05421638_0460 [Kaistella treverensis]|uniref:Uncharacterized protein n=1 Tax=Kaistella treverensis TaxID=631455 RepID=A0A1I3JXT8_9FLAO|nr:hypothetical protein [Kaistella treverensis]SFI64994.1 hypothetical protein SAMN05421638_0460 [Kaistella treverensis]
MKKKFTIAVLTAMSIFSYAQVGINTTTPNGATVLDIHSNEKGILIPKLTDVQRDTNLADNNPATVPPAGVANAALTEGTLIFNTTSNAFQYWDGTLWRQFFVATSSVAGNDGVVKILSGGTGQVKPVLNLQAAHGTYGPEQQVLYQIPLNFAPSPTTSWPETTPDVADKTPYIYLNSPSGRFRENEIGGQVHIWRLVVFANAGSGATGSINAKFQNTVSGFIVNSIGMVPAASNFSPGNVVTFYFYTIADPDSLAPGQGYQLTLSADINVNVTIDSFTRVSLFKD